MDDQLTAQRHLDRECLRQRFDEVREQFQASRQRFLERQAAASDPVRAHVRDTVMSRLQSRLETLPTIEQAKGIIMAESGVSADEAFDILRRASQRTNIKLRDLAVDIVTRSERQRGHLRGIQPLRVRGPRGPA
jgi:AmiR/NasT family two-component response regulator